jgi:hypothetical protein
MFNLSSKKARTLKEMNGREPVNNNNLKQSPPRRDNPLLVESLGNFYETESGMSVVFNPSKKGGQRYDGP